MRRPSSIIVQHHLVVAAVVAAGVASCSGDEGANGTSTTGTGPGGAGMSQAGGAAGSGGVAMGGAGQSSTAGSAGTGGSSGGNMAVDASGGGPGNVDASTPDLVVSPAELIFAGVQNTRSMPKTISIKNNGVAAARIESVALDAPMASAFDLAMAPPAASPVAPGGTASIDVVFRPAGIGVFQSGVIIKLSEPPGQKTVGLFGLGARGLEGENEPPLKLVVDTLGFAINVGGTTLSLGTSQPPIGDEVPAFRFKASGAEPVELVPVARYSPQGLLPYGYYTAAGGEVVIGVVSANQNQTLYPGTEQGAKTTFTAPGEFGIFTESGHKTYTEDPKNAANQTSHAVRTYPLKNRQGTPVANAYLLCMEEAANGDYQDYVFRLSNVVPVAR